MSTNDPTTTTTESNGATPPQPAVRPRRATPAKINDKIGDVAVSYREGEEIETRVVETKTTTIKGEVKGNDATATAGPLPLQTIGAQSQKRTRETDLVLWLRYWRKFGEDYERGEFGNSTAENVGAFSMTVIREPDGYISPNQPNPFRVPAPVPKSCGVHPFITDPVAFTTFLQSINEDSGGKFRVWLLDADGDPVKDWGTDRDGNPSEPNYVWTGALPNPPRINTIETAQTQATKPARVQTSDDVLDDLIKRKKKMIELGLVKETTESGGNDLLKQLESGVIPAFVTSLIGMTTAATQKALEATTNPATDERGVMSRFADNVVNSDRGQEMFWTFAGTIGTGFLAIAERLADGYLSRRNGQPSRQQNPTTEADTTGNGRANLNAPEMPHENVPDFYDFIANSVADGTPINFLTDTTIAKLAELHPAQHAQIQAGLKLMSAESLLARFVREARKAGKNETADRIERLPLDVTIPAINYMKQSLSPTTTETKGQTTNATNETGETA